MQNSHILITWTVTATLTKRIIQTFFLTLFMRIRTIQVWLEKHLQSRKCHPHTWTQCHMGNWWLQYTPHPPTHAAITTLQVWMIKAKETVTTTVENHLLWITYMFSCWIHGTYSVLLRTGHPKTITKRNISNKNITSIIHISNINRKLHMLYHFLQKTVQVCLGTSTNKYL